MPSQPVPFGKYSLLARVNTGGMAEVFRAKAFGVEGFERIVAVKRILPGIAADRDFIRMFIDEAKLAVQLNHTNIAQIFDLGRVGDSYFIALEYVHGKDLRAVFDHAQAGGRTLPLALACYVVMKISEGLDYAHRKRDVSGRELALVHRDVSPQNVLISFDGDVKLIDFGIAKAAGNARRTGTGVLRGKFGYLSPEQARGERVDRRSDLFGLGIVLHELLTGQRLFVSDGEQSALEKVRSAAIPLPSTLNRAVPAVLDAIVMKALSRDLRTRHQTALELHDELRTFLQGLGGPCGREELSDYMLLEFPEDAARDLELVGDLEGTESIAAAQTALPSSVADPEPSAVPKESSEAPKTGKPKRPATILGMPPVLPPADLAARPSTRVSPPPPPPTGKLTTGAVPRLAPPPPRSAPPPPRRSAPPPPPPPVRATSIPPPPPTSASSAGQPSLDIPPALSLPAPVAPSALPVSRPVARPGPSLPSNIDRGGSPSTTLLGTGPSAGPSSGGAVLNMDWDDDNLSTQIYDRPDFDRIEAGFDELANRAALERAQSGFGSLRPLNFGYEGSGRVEPTTTPPPRVQVASHAFARSEASPRSEPLPSVRPAAITHPITGDRDRRNPLYAALAVAGVVLLCFIGYVFLARTEPGMLQLTTYPSDAVLLFDGQRIGTLSPFVVTGVTPHAKHTLEVQKPGYRSWSQDVQVQAGQTLQFPVTLQPSTGGDAVGASTAVQEVPGGFSIESSPPGAAVILDGKPLSGQTPLRVGNLLPRGYEVRLRLAGFREHQQRVDVRAGVDQPLARVALIPERVRVRVSSDPSGAEAILVRGDERRELGRTPVDVTLENDDARWTLEVARSGYERFEQPLSFPDGSAELSVRAELRRRGRASAADDEEEDASNDAPRESRSSRRSARSSETTSSGSERAPAASGTGTLRINSRPWSQVSVDGRAIGNTPQMNLSLPAGNHRITLVNPEFNLRKTLTVKIVAGQVETHIVALQ